MNANQEKMSPKYDSQWLIEFAERCPIQSNINEFGDIEDLPNEALIVMWKINEMEIIPLNRREIYWMKIWLREIYRIMVQSLFLEKDIQDEDPTIDLEIEYLLVKDLTIDLEMDDRYRSSNSYIPTLYDVF